MAGRTTFIIAHRLSTIELADEIVVLDHGRIVAHGNHEQLLETSELYREIVAGRAASRRRRLPHARDRSRTRGEAAMSPPAAAEAGGGGGGARAGSVRAGAAASSGRASAPAAGQPRAQPARPAGAAAPYRLRATAMRSSRSCSAPPPRSRRRCWPSSRSTRASKSHDTKHAVLVVIAFLVSALLVWAMTYAQTYLVGWVGQRALADLRIRIFTHLQSQPIGFYESRPPAC
jgi:ABC-type multidrug transport system fused ATPase/permease subunit